MRQLSAFDAIMAYAESSRTPMHVSPFFIYDQSTAPGGIVRFKDIIETFKRRLPHAPLLRQKLLRVPFDLDEPYWVDDPDFELEHHLRHIALPKPGDRRQLSILLARLHSLPLDMSRPPWDVFIIEGLDNVDGVPPGSFAMLLRIHHAGIDGHSGHAILQVLHDLGEQSSLEEVPDDWQPRPLPKTTKLMRSAAFRLMTKPGKVWKFGSQSLPAISRVRRVKEAFPGEQRKVPETRFSADLSGNKTVSLVPLPLTGLRDAKQAVEGATVNDAVVTVVAGAMRRYLDAKGELPEDSMTTAMPINIRTDDDKDTPGNLVSLSTLDMHSDIDDPLERLAAIHDSAVYSKAYHSAVGARIMSDLAEAIPAGIASAGIRVASSAGLISNVPANTIVTNVPGPQVPLYMAGARVVEFHAIGILLDGLCLFHSVNSYCGTVAVTVLSDRKIMPDPEFYEQCLRASYQELCDAATKVKKAPAKAASKPRAKVRKAGASA